MNHWMVDRASLPALRAGVRSALQALAVGLALSATSALAQRDLTDIPSSDPAVELAAFQVGEGLEVNLFAADPLLAKPIQMNFDPAGRLWVATSEVYPQIRPGEIANDKVLVLEDADGDGRAEKTTVFADGLLIPTGVAPGDGGAYVGNSTELLHFADSDGDLVADGRRVVLSGFGAEDTHHILHTFRWGNDGLLNFNQSIYIHSHIETPWGVRRLLGGGVWQFRPETMELSVLAKGLVNPWGHHFDRWGQSFATDGAGAEGINHLFPGAVFTTSPGAERILQGLSPGSPKHCGLEMVDGRHLPPEWQGSFVTNDFRAHRVCRFTLAEQGSSFVAREQPELIKTTFVSFRPVDIKMGPDGALYLADWYNPIIQHGEVDFRDERRDHQHGRIWRITAKGRPLVERPKLVGATTAELLDQLRSPEGWTRTQAKRVLKERGHEVLPELAAWVAAIDRQSPDAEHARLEALWTYQTLNQVEPVLLNELLESRDHRVRAAATRVASQWRDRLPNAVELLARRVADSSSQARLEAVSALGAIGTLEAARLALSALDWPLDENLDFAVWLAARETSRAWLPALAAGKFDFDGDERRLEFALRAVGTTEVVGPLLTLMRGGRMSNDGVVRSLAIVAALGTPNELAGALGQLLSDQSAPPAEVARRLSALVEGSQARDVRPVAGLERLGDLLNSDDRELLAAAARAAGGWRAQSLAPRLIALASRPSADANTRLAAIDGLARLEGTAVCDALLRLAGADQPSAVRGRAVVALSTNDPPSAALTAAELLADDVASLEIEATLAAVLARPAIHEPLASALAGRAIPADTAKMALRVAQSAARPNPQLIEALRTAGGLGGMRPVELSSEEISKLVSEVAAEGDATRGEFVFRRQEQACLKCHAIGGAGGQVGPDLSSIGASAQVDYLIDSILLPNKAIKENYHSLVVQTTDGRLLSGVRLRESDTELVLRTAEDQELSIPRGVIEEQANGMSLMPAGLADQLTRRDLVDLVKFLSELGKVGSFAVGNARVARRWEVLTYTKEAGELLRRERLGVAASQGDDPIFQWSPAYSQVSGGLPLDAIPVLFHGRGSFVKLPEVGIARFAFKALSGGRALFAFNSVEGLSAWIDDRPIDLAAETLVDVAAGEHRMTFVIDSEARSVPLRCELVDSPSATAKVEIVTGK